MWESFGRRGGGVCGILRFFFKYVWGMLDVGYPLGCLLDVCLMFSVFGLMLIDMLGVSCLIDILGCLLD